MKKDWPPALCALACSGVYAYRALLKGCASLVQLQGYRVEFAIH